MTFLEAIEALERKTGKLNLRWPDGELMSPLQAMGYIGEYFGERYDRCITELYEGRSTVDVYFMEMVKMIHDYMQRDREPF